jgi:hypothetical protein
MSQSKKPGPIQLDLRLGREAEPSPKSNSQSRPPLRLIEGQGQKKDSPIVSRDGAVRALIEAGADLLLRRISCERAEEIRCSVDRIMILFDRVDVSPELTPVLRRQLDGLEVLMRETRASGARKGK